LAIHPCNIKLQGFLLDFPKKVNTRKKLSDLLTSRTLNGSNETNIRFDISEWDLQSKIEKKEYEIVEDNQFIRLASSEMVKNANRATNHEKGKSDLTIETSDGIFPISLKKEENNRIINSTPNSNKTGKVGDTINKAINHIDRNISKSDFNMTKGNIDKESLISNLNSLSLEDKEGFIINMFNLFPEYLTFEIIGDGKNEEFATAKIYNSANYVKNKLSISDVNFSISKTTSKQMIITAEINTVYGLKRIDYNLREKSQTKSKNLYFGLELTTKGLEDFMNTLSAILIDKNKDIKTPSDAITIFNQKHNQVKASKELLANGYQYLGDDKYQKGEKVLKLQDDGETQDISGLMKKNNLTQPRF